MTSRYGWMLQQQRLTGMISSYSICSSRCVRFEPLSSWHRAWRGCLPPSTAFNRETDSAIVVVMASKLCGLDAVRASLTPFLRELTFEES
eukprot:5452533-Pyramimonas_sp.AAC.1